MTRTAKIERKTAETDIRLALDLDVPGTAEIDTGVGFLDHMLELFARHGSFGLQVAATGDLQVDQHHTVEDVGICLGQAIREALGRQSRDPPLRALHVAHGGDARDGRSRSSGRYCLVFDASMPTEKIGQFDSQLVEDFWQAVAANALCNLHVVLHHGRNSHHIAEAVFKGAARALRMAVDIDPRVEGVPSTKGVL